MAEPPWKTVKLSLERPYKDDNGDFVQELLDIAPDGQHIYQLEEDAVAKLGDKMRRIFVERGIDFFEKKEDDRKHATTSISNAGGEGERPYDDRSKDVSGFKTMTPDELSKMRMEMLPSLHTALGEISLARDLLSLLLSSNPSNQASPIPSLPSSSLTAAVVANSPPIASVIAFNAELILGGKDEALRAASSIFKVAAQTMERSSNLGDRYWADALKIRKCNWGLLPAPLPFGTHVGKGSDRTARDFMVFFGLEESSVLFQRRAIGHMAYDKLQSSPLGFPHHQRARLQIFLSVLGLNHTTRTFHNRLLPEDNTSLHGSLTTAQWEVVEQEIFAELMREASNLPTAAARVSERLIVIDAAQSVELRFELVDADHRKTDPHSDDGDNYGDDWGSVVCDLVHSALHVLLLRVHAHRKLNRLRTKGASRDSSQANGTTPPLLQPIIDLLQYKVFCERIEAELRKVTRALSAAGVPSWLRFNAIGETGEELVNYLQGHGVTAIGGDCLLNIDDRQSVQLTFVSPSSLTAHLPEATLPISSIPQLSQLLVDEVERALLDRICELGTQLCENVIGIWFVDLLSGRTVGRWDGCVLNFRIYCGVDFSINCAVSRLDHRGSKRATVLASYDTTDDMSLLTWVHEIIKEYSSKSSTS